LEQSQFFGYLKRERERHAVRRNLKTSLWVSTVLFLNRLCIVTQGAVLTLDKRRQFPGEGTNAGFYERSRNVHRRTAIIDPSPREHPVVEDEKAARPRSSDNDSATEPTNGCSGTGLSPVARTTCASAAVVSSSNLTSNPSSVAYADAISPIQLNRTLSNRCEPHCSDVSQACSPVSTGTRVKPNV
jgi:hypothetical protein